VRSHAYTGWSEGGGSSRISRAFGAEVGAADVGSTGGGVVTAASTTAAVTEGGSADGAGSVGTGVVFVVAVGSGMAGVFVVADASTGGGAGDAGGGVGGVDAGGGVGGVGAVEDVEDWGGVRDAVGAVDEGFDAVGGCAAPPAGLAAGLGVTGATAPASPSGSSRLVASHTRSSRSVASEGASTGVSCRTPRLSRTTRTQPLLPPVRCAPGPVSVVDSSKPAIRAMVAQSAGSSLGGNTSGTPAAARATQTSTIIGLRPRDGCEAWTPHARMLAPDSLQRQPRRRGVPAGAGVAVPGSTDDVYLDARA
jgi:hypothetical protein